MRSTQPRTAPVTTAAGSSRIAAMARRVSSWASWRGLDVGTGNAALAGAMTRAGRIGATPSNAVSFLMLFVFGAAGCNRPLPQTGDGGPDGGVLSGADGGAAAADSASPVADSGQPIADSGQPTTDSGAPAPDSGTPPADAGGWSAPPRCALPFDVGPCDASVRVYAFVDGACVPR